MTRDNVKILDCTIRDGGLVNNWEFSTEFVADLYRGLCDAGVEYMEIGYKNSPKLLKSDGAGPWRFLDEAFIREVIPAKGYTKLSALVDIGRVDENDILPREQSSLDLIRVACYIKDVDKALDLVQKFHDLGYETSLNIMALSHVLEHELVEALAEIEKSSVDMAYVVDSYGSLNHRDIEYLVGVFKKHLPSKTIGVHTHNNLQLAFSNTITAAEHGAVFLDSSLYGMGRAAGNCHTELLVSYMKNTRYELRPLLGVIEKHMLRIRERWEWGYIIPFMIAGALDEHPRVAMAVRNSADKDKFTDFYDKLTSVETADAAKKQD
jgi:4-hydroxy 2-oxovalerate aldolase